MKNSIRTKIVASAMALAATGTLAGLAGAGTASAGAPLPPPSGVLVGPFGTAQACIDAYGSPMLPKTDCFYSVSPAGWYFIGGIGA